MSDVRLETPRVVVLMDDGTSHTVQVLNPDYLRWDRTSAKHGWPAMAKAPHTWLTFVAWSAMRRTGLTESTWEDFSERLCVQVTNAKPDDVNGTGPEGEAATLVGAALAPDLTDLIGGTEADPTQPDPGPE